MSEPLKYKVEKAITGFITAAADAALSGWSYYEGQSAASASVPFIGVVITDIRESFDDAMPKDVRVEVQVVSAVDTDRDADTIEGEATDRAANWITHRAAVAAVESRMQNLTAFKAYANKTNITDRPVSDFYVYDVQEDLQQSTAPGETRLFLSTLTYTVVCEAQDN